MSFNNYKKFTTESTTESKTESTTKTNNNKIPEVKIPQNEQLNQGSSNNVFDVVNSLRQRLMQLENTVTELSRMCPHNNNNNNNNYKNN